MWRNIPLILNSEDFLMIYTIKYCQHPLTNPPWLYITLGTCPGCMTVALSSSISVTSRFPIFHMMCGVNLSSTHPIWLLLLDCSKSRWKLPVNIGPTWLMFTYCQKTSIQNKLNCEKHENGNYLSGKSENGRKCLEYSPKHVSLKKNLSLTSIYPISYILYLSLYISLSTFHLFHYLTSSTPSLKQEQEMLKS